MRTSFLLAAALLLAVGANAGVLYEVEIESTTPIIGGVVVTTVGQSSGFSTVNMGWWGGGSAFVGTTIILPPTTSAISTITIKAGNFSALSVTRGGSVMGGVQSNEICAYLFGFCAVSFTTQTGQAGTSYASAYGINVTVLGQQWTTGQAVASGLTSLGVALPNVTTTGAFNITTGTPYGHIGRGTIQLVVANTLIISGPGYGLQSTTATPTILRLSFTPGYIAEPGNLLLLGAGALGLALANRRRG